MTIRAYAAEDADQVRDVWRRASKIAHHFLTDDFLAQEEVEIRDKWMPIVETHVYQLEGRVVGFISLLETEVGAIFVDPDHQGSGIGRALMDKAREIRPFLELNVFEANEIGRRFYRAYGFVEIGRTVHEATGQSEIRMRLG